MVDSIKVLGIYNVAHISAPRRDPPFCYFAVVPSVLNIDARSWLRMWSSVYPSNIRPIGRVEGGVTYSRGNP